MTINFYLRFHTHFGQSLLISGSNDQLGNDVIADAVPMKYFDKEFWHVSIEILHAGDEAELKYRYILKDENGSETIESGDERVLDLEQIKTKEILCVDTWNYSGEIANVFFTQPFQNVLLRQAAAVIKPKKKKAKDNFFTHEFRVKATLTSRDEVICLSGTGKTLGEWEEDEVVLLARQGNWWVAKADLHKDSFPITYKYGIYNITDKRFVRYETGNNRILHGDISKRKLTIQHDGYIHLPVSPWKGAGVAIPVFSLRSRNSFGIGEFTDIKLLVDWAKATGLRMVQLLPVNDTTATHTEADSYPYAAISAFAFHPGYLSLEKVAGSKYADIIRPLRKKQRSLNELEAIDYAQVMKFKFSALGELYAVMKEDFKNDKLYFEFFELNRHWLVPYAAFCYLRDKNGTSDFNQWKAFRVYSEDAVQRLVSVNQKHYDEIALHYFTQYHLHLQMKEASLYAHKQNVIIKGDIAIGVYRYGVDAWMNPQLYNMDQQAGAPPDDFAVKGQNWSFPTYNWKKMQEDGYMWWRQRFEQMSNYFDAFRIDHILGFFRIWSIPLHAVEGILGRFVPALPVHINEFSKNGISVNPFRYCSPYITDEVLAEIFNDDAGYVIDHFLQENGTNSYILKAEFNTQRKVGEHFKEHAGEREDLRQGLFDLISNVIMIADEDSPMEHFHFRIGMENTISFRHLDGHSQYILKNLYVDYFFRRQDDFWKQEAMKKLPELKHSTNMLICGEDLGMVPDCVPDVMKQLGILSLEIQRMPKDPGKEFFHPNDAPYLSVVTPSTHDMSTIRGWWEENQAKTQRFYSNQLGRYGAAPYFCEPWVNLEIVLQHLYSPAMWSVFQLQDILGMSGALRLDDPNKERINIPSDPKHYWKYRMHVYLEDLIKQTEFNDDFRSHLLASGRAD